ncbi:RbsD/FucU domain-containing protein [Viridibacillus sp. FSL R5-0477]|uniref:Fucose dissimilation pathway protein FucU n=1 Tax=Viridibacillus arenosi FSL R5-213 TaxID=1227360 RepID=W4EQS7_9BACL|nr:MULTISPECIES: RbsD/FucU domain-containing protein [Viridibacillus]ETT82357.1 fucose dissimilation pathway protein FucU [Viridibacillus arenosi FSL R5-213]OMC85339.1 fucose isomerase [Viridibacillus sp. FSL H8-0123]OMC87383.1 fucose isomerase [Viridibacillus sp. FSL H7-0596]OMC92544.1 fucose isomerase [Viridibacillus arenosi]
MLKYIKSCISPELLKVLMEMGHSDEIVLADGNFPAASHNDKIVRLDGNDIPSILEGILFLMPLDTYVENPICLMMHGEEVERPQIWKEYEELVTKSENVFKAEYLSRESFYERAKTAYAIVTTSEKALYANIILKKGVIVEG